MTKNHILRRVIFGLFALSLPLMWYACSPTKLIGQWARDDEPKTFENLGIVALTPKVSSKAIVESEVAEALIAKKIRALPTFDIFPFAGQKELVDKMDIDADSLRQYMHKRLDKFDIDGLLVISLLDEQKELRYNQGSGVAIGMPMYGQTWHGYYSHVYTSVYRPGYYSQSSTYFVESNLYDVESEQLLWSGQTKTKDPSSMAEESKNFARIITDAIMEKKVIKP